MICQHCRLPCFMLFPCAVRGFVCARCVTNGVGNQLTAIEERVTLDVALGRAVSRANGGV